MVDYPIRVRIDPSDSQAGSRAVRTSLEGIEAQANKTKAAVKDATTIDPSGSASSAGVVENNLDKITDAARRTGVTVERALDFSGVRPNFAPALGSLDGLALKAGVTGAAINKIEWTGSARFIGQFNNADNAVERLEAEITKLQSQLNTLSRTPGPTEKMGPSLRQTQQATLQAGQQFQDFAQQVTLGINPITAFTQQAGQMAFAMSNMEGKAGAVGRFLGGPWGTLVLVAASVLGQFAYKMYEAGDATDEAKDAMEEFSRKQTDLANFVSIATAKIIDQSNALKVLAQSKNINTLADQRQLAEQSRLDAFDKARALAEKGREFTAERQPARIIYDLKLAGAIADANGDTQKLVQNINNLGPAYRYVAREVSIAGDAAINYNRLQKDAISNAKILNGDQEEAKRRSADYQLTQVQLANATSVREKAQIQLNQATRAYNDIVRAQGGADNAQAKSQLAEVDRLTKAVNLARDDEKSAKASASASRKNAAEAEKAGERYDEAIRRLKAEGQLVDLYGKEYEIRKAQNNIEASLRRTLTQGKGGEADQVRGIVELNLARKAEGDILRQLRQPIDDYKTQIEALANLLDQGKISQEEYNAQIRALPLQDALDKVEVSLIGTMDRYDAQLRAITRTIDNAISAIRAAQSAGILSKDEADTKVAALRAPSKGSTTGPNGEIILEANSKQDTLESRMKDQIALDRRDEGNRIDQQIGGKLGQDAEFDAIKIRHDQQLAELKRFYGEKYATDQEYIKRKDLLDKKQAREEKEYRRAQRQVAIQSAANTFDTLANLAEEFGGKQSAAYKAMFAVSKAFAIADSIIKIQQGIANALSLPFPANIAAAGAVVAKAASIVSNIRAVTLAFRDGGYVNGAGGPRDDKNLAWLSNGEFVMNANATARNRPILEAMNSGSDIGSGISRPTAASAGGGGTVVQIGGINVAVESTGDPRQDGAVVGEAVREAIKGIVFDEIRTQSRSGGALTRTRPSLLSS